MKFTKPGRWDTNISYDYDYIQDLVVYIHDIIITTDNTYIKGE